MFFCIKVNSFFYCKHSTDIFTKKISSFTLKFYSSDFIVGIVVVVGVDILDLCSTLEHLPVDSSHPVVDNQVVVALDIQAAVEDNLAAAAIDLAD